MSEVPARSAPWYQFGSADIVFVVLCLLIFPAAKGKMLSDPGLGWHLRNIDAMRAVGGSLTVDPFSQPRDGVHQPWRTNLWLFPLFAAWANTHGGFVAGFIVLAVALFAETLLALHPFHSETREAARRRWLVLALLSAGAFVATLVNPYGWSLYPWVFS